MGEPIWLCIDVCERYIVIHVTTYSLLVCGTFRNRDKGRGVSCRACSGIVSGAGNQQLCWSRHGSLADCCPGSAQEMPSLSAEEEAVDLVNDDEL